MTSRGIEFLQNWVSGKVPPLPVGDTEFVKMLAQRLRNDAAAAGFTLADMELQASQVEPFIRETLARIAEPGMPGD